VDDEVLIRDAMSQLFMQWGSKYIVTDCLENAKNELRKSDAAPDIIIADYRLRNEATGIEFIKSIRSQYKKNIPAIIVTGDTSACRLNEADSYNAELIHKPVKPAKLRLVIEDMLESKC
jgi:DNA-binding NtrC family response regulator